MVFSLSNIGKISVKRCHLQSNRDTMLAIASRTNSFPKVREEERERESE